MKILVDANVLYSAFIHSPHNPIGRALLWAIRNHDLVTTEYVIEETLRIARKRDKNSEHFESAFLLTPSLTFLEDVYGIVEDVPIIRDKKDQPILNAAVIHGVDILISGDGDFLSLADHLIKPRIMNATQFREEFMPENE